MKWQMTTKVKSIIILFAIASTSTSAIGAKKEKMKKMSMTPNQRQSMASAHEKMASCLRSEKSFEDCHKEMNQSCREMMGGDGCPMMGQMMSKDMIPMKDQMNDHLKEEVKESP